MSIYPGGRVAPNAHFDKLSTSFEGHIETTNEWRIFLSRVVSVRAGRAPAQLDHRVFYRLYRQHNLRAFALFALDLQPATREFRAFVHADETEMSRGFFGL